MDNSFDLVSLMKNHEKNHKNKPTQFSSVAKGVRKRLDKNILYRRSSRLTIFDSIRNLPSCVPEPISESQNKVDHRRMQLEKWKQEKDKKKKEAAALKKKPFVAGIAHPQLKYVPPPPLKPMPSMSGRVTRSQSSKANSQVKNTKVSKTTKASQSFAPSNASFKPPQLNNSAKLPTLVPIVADKKKNIDISFNPIEHNINKESLAPNSAKSNKPRKLYASKINSSSKSKQTEKPIDSKSPVKPKRKISLHSSVSNSNNESSTKNSITKNKTPRKSKKSENQLIFPKNTIPKSESSSEEQLRSPKSSSFEEHLIPRKSLSNTLKTPEQILNANNISPCVTLSRGKDNARREMKKKMEEGLLDDDCSNMDSVDYFRCQLDSEVKRITEMCDTWEKISHQVPLTETAMEMLLGAVGQGRLLVSQKLAQFGSLVVTCARPEPGAALVTPADLHGFWDMVFMQVENVDMRFKKLEDLRARNWVEEQPIVQKRKVAKVVKNTTKPAATSRLRDLIAAARKAKKAEPSQTEVVVEDTEKTSKTFDAGFFCVQSPVKSPQVPSTPSNKTSLLKSVLSSEAKKASASKNSASSLAMLRASFIGKNMDSSDMITSEHLTPINLTSTPARSILKSTKKASTKRKSTKKSIKVVLFNDFDIDSLEIQGDSFAQTEDNEKLTETIDSGLSSLDIDKEVENKENVKHKSKLTRQNAIEDERSPVLTRSRRKSMNTPLLDMDNLEDNRRSRGRAKEEDTEEKTIQTPKRSTRRKKNSVINISYVA